MPVRNAHASWEGNLQEGKGMMKLGSGAFQGAYSYKTRGEDEPGTNPEELVGAALAGCFSMALSSALGKAGFTPVRIQTNAQVHLGKVEGKSRITEINLTTEAEVPGISQEAFMKIAEETKSGCPVSAALTGVKITLAAHLLP